MRWISARYEEREFIERQPFVATAIKLRTCKFLVQFLPITQAPTENLKVLHIMPQVWHMFSCESLICDDDDTMSEQLGEQGQHRQTHDLEPKQARLSPWEVHHSASHLERPLCRSGQTTRHLWAMKTLITQYDNVPSLPKPMVRRLRPAFRANRGVLRTWFTRSVV